MSRLVSITTAGIALMLATTLTGCGSQSPETESGSSSVAPETDCAAFEKYGDLSGSTVTVFSTIAEESEVGPHRESYKPFEECTGATIEYEGSRDFETQMGVRIEAGNAPDIAFFPQPGLLAALVDRYPDSFVPASAGTTENMKAYYSEAWSSYGTVDGVLYGVPINSDVKSLVWYSPKQFADVGYSVPETWEDLMVLSEKITADHPDGDVKAWCAGIESGDATGWPATDWVEDMMLRTATPEQYDKWVSNELKFNDPIVVEAIDKAGSILKNENYVNGGWGNVASIATTPYTEAGLPVLDGTCFLHRAPSFYQSSWGDGVDVSESGDVWAFYLPANANATEKPVLGGGNFAVALADRPEVMAFHEYLSSPEWSNAKAAATPNGGWMSANSELDPALLVQPIDQLSYRILTDDEVVSRFDASDMMPAAVGSGSFWTEMTKWVAQDQSSQQTADAIQASWPNQ